MKKLIAAVLLAKFAGFGLLGQAIDHPPAAFGVASDVVAKVPAPFGLVGEVVAHGPTLGFVQTAFADSHPADAPAPAQPPAAKSEMSNADVTKWLTFFNKLVVTVVHTATACDKMAVDVNAVVDANKSAIELAKNAKAAGKKLPDDAKAKMVEGVKQMMPGLQNCGSNDKVRMAFAKLDLTK